METVIPNNKILVADDDETLNEYIRTFFDMKGFDVMHAFDGREAVEIEEKFRPDIVILDVDMPVMNGLGACEIIRSRRNGVNYIPVIFLSANLKESTIVEGLELGADDYVRKPFSNIELLTRVNNLLKMREFIRQMELFENVLFSLIKSIEARDSYTAGHSLNVTAIAVSMGRALDFSLKELGILRKGALLHDIGKLGVPDLILNKKDKLHPDGLLVVKEHATMGKKICERLSFDPNIIDIIYHHHEKLNGSGYPEKLKDGQISKYVRVVSVADIFDALTTERPYRAAMTEADAVAILHKEANEGLISKDMVACLEKLVDKGIIKKELIMENISFEMI